jgi:hypothetical protein
MLPSAAETASASQRCEISELNLHGLLPCCVRFGTHQSPGEWQHSLPACSLALAGRDSHPLDFIKWFPLLHCRFLHFHAYPSATQRSLTLWPARSPSRLATLCTRGFSSFVASTTALIATGWSEPVPGRVYPAVDHRLFTARAPDYPTTVCHEHERRKTE